MERGVHDEAAGEDAWSRWLLRERFGGDERQRERVLAVLAPIRDRVLDGARLAPGDEVLDVGCGDGLLALAAADRVGPSGRVVFSDLSEDLLGTCRALAGAAGVVDRCTFVAAALPELAGVESASVDAAVLRSVLIYVQDRLRGNHRRSAILQSSRCTTVRQRLLVLAPVDSAGARE